MISFVKQHPIGEGVAVITAKEPAEMRPLLRACQLTEIFLRDLIELAMQSLLENAKSNDCELLLLYRFGKPVFTNLAAYRGGLAVIHVRALHRPNGNGRGVFIFYEQAQKSQAELFARGVFEQIRKEAEQNGAKFAR